MRATLDQTSIEPGSTGYVRATLTEYGLPVEGRATVRADVTGPAGSTIPFTETGPGLFEAAVPVPLPGTYQIRVVANGLTLRGAPFTREQLLTAVALPGGDTPPPGPGPDSRHLGDLLKCLTKAGARALERNGVDPEAVLRCVRQHCAHGTINPR